MSVQIADDDAGGAIVEVTVSVTNGTITFPTGRVTVLTGASGTNVITFEGTITDINTALSSFSLSPTADFVGLGEVQITVDDHGNTGGPAQTATESLFVDVQSVIDAPIAVDDPADYSNAVLAQTPVGYYRLGEASGPTANNLGPSGIDGTYSGPTLGAAGQSGSETAADFNGSTDYGDLGTLDVAGTGLTLSAWINADSFVPNKDHRIISKGDSGGQGIADLWWMLSKEDVLGENHLRFRVKAGGTTSTLVASTVDLPTGEWQFATATYDAASGSMKLFLNGTEIASSSHAIGGAVNTDPAKSIWVGANPNSAAHFDGRIDEVAILDKALSQSELQVTFQNGSGAYTAIEDTLLTINAANGRLSNDTDVENDTLTANLISGPSNAASFTLNADGSFTYIAAADFTGTDSFVYRASDGRDYSNDATVSISVTGVNDAPIAVDDRSAQTFDGIDDYLDAGTGMELEITGASVTMEAWVNPAAYNATTGSIVLNREGEYEIGISETGTLRWAINNSDPGWTWHDTGYVIPLNVWSHLAISNDNGVVSTFVNGALVDVYNGSGNIGDSHADKDSFRIGSRENSPTGRYFNGQIDEVRIWEISRTQSEIVANLDQSLSPQAGLVGYWQFDEGTGTLASDSARPREATLINGGSGNGPVWIDYRTDEDSPLSVSIAFGVLSNDINVDGDWLIVSETEGSSGKVGSQFTLASGAFLTLNGDGSVDYDPNSQFDHLTTGQTATDSWTYIISDGNGGTDTAIATVHLTGVNDAPQATNLNAAESYTEDVALNLTNIVISDADDTDVTVTLTLSDTSDGLLNTATSGAVTSTFAGGVWTASGAIAYVNTLLAGINFIPTSDYNSSFTIATSVDDGEAAAITGVKNFTATAVNDAPINVMAMLPGQTATTSADGASSVATGDGDIDFVSASIIDNTIAWYEYDGAALPSFTVQTITTSALGARLVSVADVDGDLDLDIIAASTNDNTIAWYLNDGVGRFTQRVITATAVGATSAFATDIDNDGDLVIVASSYQDDTIAWYENDGSQNFTYNAIDLAAEGAWMIQLVDLDGDTDMDVVAANWFGSEIAWYENGGGVNPSFSKQVVSSTISGASSVYADDIDGDGDIDLLATSFFNDTVSLFTNDGAEVFSETILTNQADGAHQAIMADVDGDGDQDIIAAASSSGEFLWFENDGNPTPAFQQYTLSTGNAGPMAMAVDDLNNDGTLDIVTAILNDDAIVVHENDSGQLAAVWTMEGTPLVFNTANGNLISISDIDANGGLMEITLTVRQRHTHAQSIQWSEL